MLELIQTPPQDIIGLSEFLRQLRTLRLKSEPASEKTEQKWQLSAIQLFGTKNYRKEFISLFTLPIS